MLLEIQEYEYLDHFLCYLQIESILFLWVLLLLIPITALILLKRWFLVFLRLESSLYLHASLHMRYCQDCRIV